MTTYSPMRYYAGGVELFTVADPRVDGLLTGSSEATTPALLHARALLAQSQDRSVMIYVGGSSTAEGGSSSTTKRFGDRFLTQLQTAYKSGLGTETAVTYGANTPDTTVGLHEVNRGTSGSTAAGANPAAGIVASNADIGVYMWGSNDIVTSDTPAADYEVRMRDVIADVDAAASKQVIHILGNHQPRLVWTDGSARRLLWAEYTQALYNIAADFPETVLVINASATFEAMWDNGDTSVWSGDGTHVHDRGNAILADVYARALLC